MKQNDIEKAIVVQKDQIDKVPNKLSELNKQLENVSDTEKENRNDLDAIDKKMANMFKELGIDRNQLNLEGVQSKVKLDKSELSDIENNLYKFKPLETIEYNDWQDYKEKINEYIDKYDIDLSIDPIAQMLTPQQYAQIEQKYKQQFEKYKWDKCDYIFVGSSGILAAITDYFFAAIPKTLTKGVYKNQKGSVITEWLHKIKLPPALHRTLTPFPQK